MLGGQSFVIGNVCSQVTASLMAGCTGMARHWREFPNCPCLAFIRIKLAL
ncbi:hypothetical protein [Mesorhizobium carmichaelinearum]|nr:hypothetical protein [Mesorhizobium carmichaelinearum]